MLTVTHSLDDVFLNFFMALSQFVGFHFQCVADPEKLGREKVSRHTTF